jgi:hypothetical protein
VLRGTLCLQALRILTLEPERVPGRVLCEIASLKSHVCTALFASGRSVVAVNGEDSQAGCVLVWCSQ